MLTTYHQENRFPKVLFWSLSGENVKTRRFSKTWPYSPETEKRTFFTLFFVRNISARTFRFYKFSDLSEKNNSPWCMVFLAHLQFTVQAAESQKPSNSTNFEIDDDVSSGKLVSQSPFLVTVGGKRQKQTFFENLALLPQNGKKYFFYTFFCPKYLY